MMYIVKSVVSDYGVFEKTDNGENLKVICNSLSNAELIADILNTDLKNTKYKAIKQTKIDKAIEEIKKLPDEYCDNYVNGAISDVLCILQESVGE